MPAHARAPITPRGALSRRSLLGGAGALGMGALLSACGTSGTGGGSASASSKPKPATDRSASEKVVNWANWTLYLDKDDKGNFTSLKQFEGKTGLKVNYYEEIDDNDSFYGKVQAQLRGGQDIGRDLVVLTDWMAARMIRQGLVQELDLSKIPNAKNLLPNLKDVAFDPGRKYSLTWQSGMTGLAYNTKLVPFEIRKVEDLWRPELKGKIEVLTEWRDTLGLIMRSQGVDVDKEFTRAQFDASLAELEKQLGNGQIRQVKGNDYKQDLENRDAWAVIGWSGDIFQVNNESNAGPWKFVVPDSGGMLWSDNLMIPVGSPHKANAEELINYYYDPAVAAQVADYVDYICPVAGAQTVMKTLDPQLSADTSIFPDKGTLDRLQVFTSLDPAQEAAYTQAFQKVLGN